MSENQFWRITDQNQVQFPLWHKLKFSQFWKDYLLSDYRRELICVGRGGGKGWNVLFKKVYRAFKKYAEVKSSGIRYTGPQWHLMIVAPTAENLGSTLAALTEMVPQIPGYAPDGNLNYRFRQSDTFDFRLFGDNELLITVLSTYSANYLRGKSADDLYVDEAFMVKRSDITDVLIQVVQRQGRPPQGGYFTCSSTPDTELLLDPWFDGACDQADPAKPECVGFFDDFKLWQGGWDVNSTLDGDSNPTLVRAIMREKLLNETVFQRERMGIRGLVVDQTNLDGTVGNIITMDMLRPCFYAERPDKSHICIAIDLAFGTRDSLTRMFYNPVSGQVFGLDVYDVKEQNRMGIQSGDYSTALIEFFKRTARDYPTATIIYDATGQHAGAVQRLMPGHIRTKAVAKNGKVKNSLVETLLERLMIVENGVNLSLRLPDPDAAWLTESQRRNFRMLYSQMVNIRKLLIQDDFDNTRSYRYTKVAPHGDDAFDALVLLMGETKPVRTQGRMSISEARRRAGR